MSARAEAAPSRHGPIAQLLISWSPLSAILVGYAVTIWVTGPLDVSSDPAQNRWGLPLHVTAPAAADRQVFEAVPSVWLQQHLLGTSPHWYDALAALVYATHFVSLPLVTALVWFGARERFRSWLAAVLTLTGTGFVGYVLYPAAPPWWASEEGVIGPVVRTPELGWDYLHLDAVGRLVALGQQGSNPVAAMPSLHAGVALLIVLFWWRSVGVLGRVALLAYALAMALTLVYTGEHYVVDVVVGWAFAVLAAVVGAVVGRRVSRRGAPPGR